MINNEIGNALLESQVVQIHIDTQHLKKREVGADAQDTIRLHNHSQNSTNIIS
jgi:hypothetical protein